MNKNFKLILGVIYTICLVILLIVLFRYFDFNNLSDYAFIQETSRDLIEYKNKNLLFFVISFFIFSVLWVFFLGFASPVALVAGFIFGKWYGTIISIFAFSLGSCLLYLFVKAYFYRFIEKYFSSKIIKYQELFNKNEFIYFMIFRLTGGAGMPFALQNILPIIFNIKLKNDFFATLLGLTPAVFIITSFGTGIENMIDNNKSLNFFDIISEPEIYYPIIGFFVILIFSYFIKQKLFKKY